MVVRVRRPIGFRPPSDQIPFAARPDFVRRPIRFRSPSDRIPSAARLDSVRRPTRLRSPSDHQHTLAKVVKIMTNAPFPHRIPLKT
mgnify:FL=1